VLRKILSIALIVVGLAVIGLAIASATLWRDSETVTAALPTDPALPIVVTEPGVLDVVANEVTVKATAPDGGPVVLAVGRDIDVLGWVGEGGHVLVTGLTSWTELAATPVEGAGELPSPAGSDMWAAQATGDAEATLDWVGAPGRWSLIAATDGKSPAPQLSLTWQREVSTPFLVPGLIVGGLILLGGVVLGIVALRRQRVPQLVLDRDAIRERLGAVPQRRRPGRHAQGSRPLDTYAGTELRGAGPAVAAGAEAAGEAAGFEAPEPEVTGAGADAAAAEPEAAEGSGWSQEPDESAEVALADSDAADADVDLAGASAEAEEVDSLEEGEADEANEPDVTGAITEFDDSRSETDEDDVDDENGAGDQNVTADAIEPKGERA
jgi:hypothetical protein